MSDSTHIKPVSCLEANRAEVAADSHDAVSFQEIRETRALLEILAQGHRQVEQGKIKPVVEVVKRLRG